MNTDYHDKPKRKYLSVVICENLRPIKFISPKTFLFFLTPLAPGFYLPEKGEKLSKCYKPGKKWKCFSTFSKFFSLFLRNPPEETPPQFSKILQIIK